MRRPWILLVTAGIVAAACSGSPAADGPASTEPAESAQGDTASPPSSTTTVGAPAATSAVDAGTSTTVPAVEAVAGAELAPEWRAVFSEVVDGVAPAPVALDAFDLAFVEGVDEPAVHGIGTMVLGWVMAQWDQLSEAERSHVEAVLDLDQAPGRRPGQGAEPTFVAELRRRAESTILPRLESTIGPLTLQPVYRSLADRVDGLAFDPAAQAATLVNFTDIVTFGATPGGECHVWLSAGLATASAEARDAVLTHELTHCLEMQPHPSYDSWSTVRPWVSEGLSDWAAVTLVPGYVEGVWPNWFGSPGVPLTARSYDALGFWALVAELYGDQAITDHFEQIVTIPLSAPSAVLAALGVDQRLWQDWGSTMAGRPEGGSAWVFDRSYVPANLATAPRSIEIAGLGQAGVSANPLTWAVADVTVTDVDEVWALLITGGPGRVLVGQSATFAQSSLLEDSVTVCVATGPEPCECQTELGEEQVNDVPASLSPTGTITVAVAGSDSSASTAQILALGRDHFCGAAADSTCTSFPTEDLAALGLDVTFSYGGGGLGFELCTINLLDRRGRPAHIESSAYWICPTSQGQVICGNYVIPAGGLSESYIGEPDADGYQIIEQLETGGPDSICAIQLYAVEGALTESERRELFDICLASLASR